MARKRSHGRHDDHRPFDWREFLLLWAAGTVGVVAVLPYLLTLQADALRELPLPLELLLPLQVAQTAVLLALVVGVGLLAANRTGLGAPLLARWLARRPVRHDLRALLVPSVVPAVLAAAVVIAADLALFAPRLPQDLSLPPHPPAWQGLLASLYGGITEELLLRLGLFSVLAWLATRIGRGPGGRPGTSALWAINAVVAVLFGLGHLPATAALLPLTPLVVARAVLLNAIPGMVFGHLYWRRGLEAAVLAHFAADVVLHVLLPPFVGQ